MAIAAALSIVGARVAAAQQAAPGAGLSLSLGYDGRLFIKVLDIQVEQRVNGQGFTASARLISTGILAAFKHVDERSSSQGRIEGGAPQPGTFDYQNLGGKTHRSVRTAWTGGEVRMWAQPAFPSLGDPPASREQQLAAADPLTQLMRMTLNPTRQSVCRQSYLFFDGKQLYALDFSAERATPPTPLETKLGLTNPYRCDVRFREVAGFARKPPEKRNQGLDRPIEVDFAQIGPGGPWVISRIRSTTPLGWATIDLRRIAVAGH